MTATDDGALVGVGDLQIRRADKRSRLDVADPSETRLPPGYRDRLRRDARSAALPRRRRAAGSAPDGTGSELDVRHRRTTGARKAPGGSPGHLRRGGQPTESCAFASGARGRPRPVHGPAVGTRRRTPGGLPSRRRGPIVEWALAYHRAASRDAVVRAVGSRRFAGRRSSAGCRAADLDPARLGGPARRAERGARLGRGTHRRRGGAAGRGAGGDAHHLRGGSAARAGRSPHGWQECGSPRPTPRGLRHLLPGA